MSSNLGVVELTVALHKHYDFEKDKLFFDVGHQCYTHKILTGRNLENLRDTLLPKLMNGEIDLDNIEI